MSEFFGEPGVTFRDAAGNVVDRLRVGRWENAFETDGEAVRVRDDFVSLDPERFYVQVFDPRAAGAVVVRLAAGGSAPRDLVLEETGPGTGEFRSHGLLLVALADDVIDESSTFLVALGDTVTASYETAAVEAAVAAERVVKLRINVLRSHPEADGGEPAVSVETVEEWVRETERIYAQAGLRFETAIQVADPPSGIDLREPFVGYPCYDGECYAMTEPERVLLGAEALRAGTGDVIEVYYVRQFDGPYVAEALRASAVPDPRYGDSVIIGADDADHRVLAHEIGHILLDDGDHVDGEDGVNGVNLMAYPRRVDGRLTDSRRLTAGQVRDVLSKRPELLRPASGSA